MASLTRRIRYEHLRQGIRRACTEYIDQISRGRAECLNPESARGPLRFRVRSPWGAPIEPDLHVGKDGIALHLADVAVSEEVRTLLSGARLTIDAPFIKIHAALKGGRLVFEPLELAYADLRPILYFAAKRLLPEKLDAEYRFSDSDFTARFSGEKTAAAQFEGELRFDPKQIVLELELKRLAALAAPMVAAQIDSQLELWTDEWATA